MSNNSTTNPRPTSTASLLLVRIAAFGSAVLGAYALGAGTWKEAESVGGLHYALPFIAAGVAGLLLAAAWHTALGYAAHTETVTERVMAACYGAALSLVGVGVSGWFLASLLGGNAALQQYQIVYLDHLKAAAEIVSLNSATESSIVSAVSGAASNLDALAEAEARTGQISGRPGKSVVYSTLKNAAAGLEAKGDALMQLQNDREAALGRFRESVEKASIAAGARNATAFESLASKAVASLTAASNSHLNVTDVGIGIDIGHARAPILQAIKQIGAVVADINKNLQDVEIPSYRPIDAKTAIIVQPQALAWFTAVVIEFLPLLLLALLLTVWRRQPSRDSERDDVIAWNSRRAALPLTPAA